MNKSQISTKPVGELLTDDKGCPNCFWIPAYQRGYRWKQLQVSQLLDDIWEFVQKSEEGPKDAFYCLQPIVIKMQKSRRIEVIDGQQRLTTIYILLTYLKELMSILKKSRFEINYETRGDANEPFLSKIDVSRCNENIDFFHICEAYHAIEAWFSKRDSTHQIKFLQHLLNDDEAGRNVKVIWYQLSDQDNPVEAFIRLNVGKIPLTNDELIRALFLRNNSDSEGESLQLRIAYEWDQLEKSLQSDSFWYFLSNEVAPSQNRIGFLFDFVARANGLPPGTEHDSYGIFYAFNQKFNDEGSRPESVWLEIKQAFMTLEEWYENRTLYHIIGFLIQQGISISKLRKMSEQCTKSDFEHKLRQEIFHRVIGPEILSDMSTDELNDCVSNRLGELAYGPHSKIIKDLLILFNIATLLENKHSTLRFPFDSFKHINQEEGWDIEHIRSIAENKPQRLHEQRAWLENCLKYFQKQNSESELKQKIEQFNAASQINKIDDEFDALYLEILQFFGESEGDEADDNIANLTLLDQSTNRSYKNAVFAIKRHRVLSLDQAGTVVPLCTRNVFLKCYSPDVDNVLFWNKADRNGYRDAIRRTLVQFFRLGEEKRM